MPVSYRVEESTGFVLSRASEAVSGDELAEYLSALLADPVVPHPLRDLSDLSAVRRFAVEPSDVHRLVSIAEANPSSTQCALLAVVAPSDHVYGMARMLEILSDASPTIEKHRARGGGSRMSVFRDIVQARSWLEAEGKEPAD